MPDEYVDDLFKSPKKRPDIPPSGEEKKSEEKLLPAFRRTKSKKNKEAVSIIEEVIRRVKPRKNLL